MFGGTRRFLALVALCTLTGCTGTTSEPERAQPPTTAAATSTSSSSTTTSTTEPADTLVEFEPLLADPALTTEEQIEAAYLFHWDVLLEAFREGRPELLDLIYVDDALELRVDELGGLIENGNRVIGAVEHNNAITILNDDLAIVIDAYRNHLQLTDASGEPIEEPSGAEELYEYRLRREEGQWMVYETIRLVP